MKPQLIEITAENGDIIQGIYQEPLQTGSNFLDPVIMVFSHGFPDSHMNHHDNLFQKLQNVCSQIGIYSIRFDYRGCGASDGAQQDFTLSSTQDDLSLIVNWCEQNEFNRMMLSAEGFGIIPSLEYLHGGIEAAALFWPIFEPKNYISDYLSLKLDKNDTQKGIIETPFGKLGSDFLNELNDFDIIKTLNNVKFPCLIQHGAQDTRIAIEHLDMARAHFRNRRIELTTYHDGTHGLPKENHRKNLMYHYEQFFQKYI